MKKLLIALFLFSLVSCNNDNSDKTNVDKSKLVDNKPKIEGKKQAPLSPMDTIDINEVKPIKITEKEEKIYLKTLKLPNIVSIRKAFDDYNAGNKTSKYFEETALINHPKFDTDNFTSVGLEYLKSQGYLKSKFSVMQVQSNPTGGQAIDIIFGAKPDAMFQIVMKETEQKSIWKLSYIAKINLTNKALNIINITYGEKLKNPKYGV